MKISILQMPAVLGRPADNIDTLRRMAYTAMDKRPDVLLMPELWDLGFYPTPIADFADKNGERIRKELSDLAAKYQVNIVGGSCAISIGKNIYNTSFVFDRNGSLISSYRKTHLFSPAGEDKDFTAGTNFPTFVLDGVKCATVICYDIRFPELVRQLALKDISVLFVPAAWPAGRLMHWDTLLRARAIENQIFVCAANGIGKSTDDFLMGGHSSIIDPWGEILAQASSDHKDGEIIHANLKLAIRDQIRESLAIYDDRRPELYK